MHFPREEEMDWNLRQETHHLSMVSSTENIDPF